MRDGDSGDAPALGCDLAKPFGSAVLVQGLVSSSQDASLRLSPDELTGYFFSARSGAQLLYSATRSGVTAPFVSVSVLANINTANQYDPVVTADGLTLFFASDRPTGAGGNDIYQATRAAPTGDFTNLQLAPNLDTAASEIQPYVTHDQTTMYFTRTVGSRTAVFRAVGTVRGFLNPAAVPEIAGPTNDSNPVQSADGLVLYWASDRPGGGGGDYDIWQARRATTSAAFSDIAPVVSVNTAGLDAPSDVSENGCRLYITSTRNGKTGIYVATRPR